MICPKCRREVVEGSLVLGPTKTSVVLDKHNETYELVGNPSGREPVEVRHTFGKALARHICGAASVSPDALDDWAIRRIEAASSETIRRWRSSIGLEERGMIQKKARPA